ncbi:hypothetical protein Sta7437_2092 [Stanieria cyanosphaera PCC 7437]|uniref:Uncharacterized protein n=1 Tax=Stanieria cyanosphaera (strain ATCC 29371 / PCC 7437) TaxID=111780 RepID=K9XSY5_STAC7|nr:hypothetical protein [Stanieria cyanosphaera]AFZ35643.1 hypothetical protein Sta7437_2092 [Stanieria cyanosphaera PCC 7437]
MKLNSIKVMTLGLVLGLTTLLGACEQTTNTPTDGGTAAPEGGAGTTEPAPAEGQ